jgi:hypothetical protein
VCVRLERLNKTGVGARRARAQDGIVEDMPTEEICMRSFYSMKNEQGS